MKENKAVIIDAVRTPIGRYGGALKGVRPDDLATLVIKTLLKRNSAISQNDIEDVLLGCTNQAGEDNRNIARMAVLLSGLPHSVGGLTFNRLCASGLDAINSAAQSIICGHGDIFIAGGVESMTRAPMVMAKSAFPFPRGNVEVFDSTIGWRFTNPKMKQFHEPIGMGITAENVATRYNITRENQDKFAFSSQQKWKAAKENGIWDNQIVPVPVPQRKGEPIIVDTDEHPRPDVPFEKLTKLKPVFAKDGSATAGNSSGINDGAAALFMTSQDKAQDLGLKPMVRFVSCAASGVDPDYMGIGPIPATLKALKRANLEIADIGLVELNEAFASQALVCIDKLGIDPEICNVNGGAIALGHPLGCTGARILTTLVHEMTRRPKVKYGLATLCVGVGQGVATIVENLTL